MTAARVSFFKRLRYRIGARLLREHVAAQLETLDHLRKARTIKGESCERLDYMSIGLKHALGTSGWRRFDDEQTLLAKESLAVMTHARDAL